MKDIRAVGGDRAISIALASAFFGAASLLGYGSSAAQDATGIYNSGRVQFRFPGWVAVDSEPRANEGRRRLITVQPDANRNSSRRCILSARDAEALLGRTQAELNAGLNEAVAEMPAERGVQMLRREVVVIDDVAVFEEEVLTPDRRFPLRSRTRHFALAADGEAISYFFFCAAVNEAANGRASDMDAVMDSLRFTEQSPP